MSKKSTRSASRIALRMFSSRSDVLEDEFFERVENYFAKLLDNVVKHVYIQNVGYRAEVLRKFPRARFLGLNEGRIVGGYRLLDVSG